MSAIAYNNARPYTAALWRLIQTMVGTTPDGIPGSDTATSVAAWQLDNNQTPDGKCGPDTLEAMGLGCFRFHDDGFSWTGKMSICADGAPTAIRPDDSGIDALANAGWPGPGWGIALDPNGVPYRQGPWQQCPNGFVSVTATNLPGYAESDQRRYVDATRIPYAVLPRNIDELLPARLRDHLGKGDMVSMARDYDQGFSQAFGTHEIKGIYAEVGPALTLDAATVYGEASVFAAVELGHNPYQLHNGVWRARNGIDEPVIDYRVYVGTRSRTRIEQGDCGQRLVIEP